MSTTAQIAANRENSLASTSPTSNEGKARSARNAVTLGLFTMNNFVLPEESAEHDAFCAAFWRELNPAGPVEETFATEMIRAAWRLRRCGILESGLAEISRTKRSPSSDSELIGSRPRPGQQHLPPGAQRSPPSSGRTAGTRSGRACRRTAEMGLNFPVPPLPCPKIRPPNRRLQNKPNSSPEARPAPAARAKNTSAAAVTTLRRSSTGPHDVH